MSIPWGTRQLHRRRRSDFGVAQQSYPAPPQSSPGNQQPKQYFPPPPAQTPSSSHSNYPPPPIQPTGNAARASFQAPSSNSSYQTVPASAPATQTTFRFPSEKPFGPPPSGGEVGSHPDSKHPTLHEKDALDDNNSANMPGGAPVAAHFVGASTAQDDVGTFNGGSFRISHRDTNTILTVQLAMGCPLVAKPGTLYLISHGQWTSGALVSVTDQFLQVP